YANAFAKLQPGRCRYGIMLTESGFVMDDGVVARLAPTRFHLTTTTGGAARVLATMEDYLQTEWPDLRVWLASVTEQWAVLAVQGPKARAVLAPFVDDIDLAPEAMPHMSVRTGHIGKVPIRLFRVSFTGELGFEINVPSGEAPAIWDLVRTRVEAEGGCLYGTEAMHVMRAEKGYIIVGQETDGTVTADDLGLGGMVSTRKPDFVGKRSLRLAELARPGRKQLVGLLSDGTVLDEGAQIVATAASREPLGHVTSAYEATTLGYPIALAVLEDGRARVGQTLTVPLLSGPVPVRVTAPVFLDPEGARLHA
ncbi:MAG: sarcosine oxidase subunit alpha, partial [Acetobacteraceae bacterium]|nr:sarcosine oxidase subunit alpha [Acetobacteraceae bacterium]